ncbi:MAG: hypothetical protein KGR26_02490 [Cyanobacteria bacterium REEB65]|nr:hypothetical protein [Cyanobacteria bacterium REEB65]
MPELEDLKESADKLALTAKESMERLSAAAKETADVGVKVFRDQIHEMVKDPAIVARMKEVEEVFDRQVAEATRQIEEGAKQLMAFWTGLASQATAASSRPKPTRVEVEIEKTEK